MQVETLALPGLLRVVPPRHGDARGWFTETWRRDRFAEAGIVDDFVQDNLSFSASPGTVRGLHFQRPPFAQSKLVRALTGRILDVVVDLRASSPTFGRHAAVELDAAVGDALYVPAGFAHGFCTLAPECLVAYRCGAVYALEAEGGLLWNDPALGIAWPVALEAAILSEKDRLWPTLAALGPVFP